FRYQGVRDHQPGHDARSGEGRDRGGLTRPFRLRPHVPGPRLNRVPLEAGDVPGLLARLPASLGVAQVLGPEGQSLLIGRPANLRRWVATQLGAGKPPKKGMRPPTNLAPITSAVAYVAASSPFAQRLAFERLMARYV